MPRPPLRPADQYSLYVNYEPAADSAFNSWNAEVTREFEAANATRMGDEAAVAAAAERPL